METSQRLSLSYVLPQQAQKHVTVNETFRRLDMLVALSVLSAARADQPANPAEGEAYILPAAPSGDVWSGFQLHAVAAFQDGAWREITPMQGLSAYVANEGAVKIFNGAEWTALSGAAGGGGGGGGIADMAPRFGVNTSADNINRLAVKSDAVLLSHDDATPGSGDMRQIINKAAAGKTASVVFQNDFSGRAEFGLVGDDDFHLKVSADGASFHDAARFDRATGAASFPGGVASIAADNMLANGAFDIWQRGDISGPSSINRYTADRWRAVCGGAAAIVSRQTLAPDDLGEQHSTYYLRMQMSAAAADAGLDRLEEPLQRFMGRSLTYSLWMRADTARSYNVDFVLDFGTGGSAVQTVSASTITVDGQWRKFSITAQMPAAAGVTFGDNPHFEVRIRHRASAAWRLDVAQAKLETGPVATPFIARSQAQELSECLRYYFKLDVAAGSGYASGPGQTQRAQTIVTFPVPMRKTPISSMHNMVYSGVNINTADGLLMLRKKPTAVIVSMRSAGAGSLYWDATGDIVFNAEIQT